MFRLGGVAVQLVVAPGSPWTWQGSVGTAVVSTGHASRMSSSSPIASGSGCGCERAGAVMVAENDDVDAWLV